MKFKTPIFIIVMIFISGCQEKPKTIEEAAKNIISKMKSKDKETIKNTSPFDLILYHHGWGTGIRNDLGLWGRNKELMKDCGNTHPDNCSMKIIYRIWQLLQNNQRENAFLIDYYSRIERAKYNLEKYITEEIPADSLDSLILFKASAVNSHDCEGNKLKAVYIAFKRSNNPSYADIRIIEHREDSIEFIEPGITMHHPDSVVNEIIEGGIHSNCEE